MVKEWIAAQIIAGIRLVSKRAYMWIMDPKRQARIRMKHRQRWWKYHCKAAKTRNKYDDMLAAAWAIQYKFETSPETAEARGDLVDPYPAH